MAMKPNQTDFYFGFEYTYVKSLYEEHLKSNTKIPSLSVILNENLVKSGNDMNVKTGLELE